MQRSASYSILFAAVVCLVCAVFVSASAVALRERQNKNAYLDKQRNVLIAAGLANDDEKLTKEDIQSRFAPIKSVVVDLATGDELSGVDPRTFDQRKNSLDPVTSRAAGKNPAGVERVPNQALVYRLEDDDELGLLILPIEGKVSGRLFMDSSRSTPTSRRSRASRSTSTKRPQGSGAKWTTRGGRPFGSAAALSARTTSRASP